MKFRLKSDSGLLQRNGTEDTMPSGHSGFRQKVLEERRSEKRHGWHMGHLKEQLFKPVSSQAPLGVSQNRLDKLLERTIGLY